MSSLQENFMTFHSWNHTPVQCQIHNQHAPETLLSKYFDEQNS